jgi:DNA-binding CsgD family transcriptional regulator
MTDKLSDREVEMMRYIRDGMTTKEAAVVMNVKFTTAREFRERAYAKLGAHNTAQAIAAFAVISLRGNS